MKVASAGPDEGGERLLGHLTGLSEVDELFHAAKFAQGELNRKRKVRSMRDAALHKANYTPDQWSGGGNMLGKPLRDWRKRNKLTLEGVANEVQTSKGHMSEMERGIRPLSSRWIEKIATAYNVPQSEIIGLAEPDPEPTGIPPDDERGQVLAEYLDLTDEARANIRSVMRQMPKRPKSEP